MMDGKVSAMAWACATTKKAEQVSCSRLKTSPGNYRKISQNKKQKEMAV